MLPYPAQVNSEARAVLFFKKKILKSKKIKNFFGLYEIGGHFGKINQNPV
jgi:hypothetical protein